VTHSAGVSALDGFVSAVGAGGALSGNPVVAPLIAYPAVRQGLRAGLLSKANQTRNVMTPAYELAKEAMNTGVPASILADAMLKAQQKDNKYKK